MRKTTTFVLAAALLLVSAPAVRGSGFLIYEHGAAAMAMAGAFASLAKDPSALWHNPAGIAWLDGTRVMGGATIIVPRGSVDFPDYPGAPHTNRRPRSSPRQRLPDPRDLEKGGRRAGRLRPLRPGHHLAGAGELPLALPGDLR